MSECRCPFLRSAAAQSELRELGLFRTGSADLSAVLVGKMRQENGCPGPDRTGRCPWKIASLYAEDLHIDPGVPLLGRNATGKDTGQFL